MTLTKDHHSNHKGIKSYDCSITAELTAKEAKALETDWDIELGEDGLYLITDRSELVVDQLESQQFNWRDHDNEDEYYSSIERAFNELGHEELMELFADAINKTSAYMVHLKLTA